MTVWSCLKCTYLHEDPREQEYLACAACASPKPNHNGLAAAASSFRATTNPKKKKRQGNLLDHFGEKPPKRQCALASNKASSSVGPSLTTTANRSILDALKPQTASSFVPRARYRDNAKEAWRELEQDQDLVKLCPLSLVRDVLPAATASKLLQQLEQESDSWNRGNWIVHGKEHLVPRTTATFNISESNTTTALQDDDNDEYRDNQKRYISLELQEAANLVAEVVKQQCPWADQDWTPTFALANRYENGQDCVGWHSDHIMKLGPRPIIVGLTLGACRRFEFKRQMSGKHETCRHVSVPLPHNSLCIMWNDAQESWQHSVPRCSDESITRHPKVGLVRISLTFRRERQIPDLGACFCGRRAGLKAKDGKYYLFCVPYGKEKSKTCNFWKPCRWAEEEALRLAQLEHLPKEEKHL